MKASLQTLLKGFIDYAGIFPPAKLAYAEALRNYRVYRSSARSWLLGGFVCPVSLIDEHIATKETLPLVLIVSSLAQLSALEKNQLSIRSLELKIAEASFSAKKLKASLDSAPLPTAVPSVFLELALEDSVLESKTCERLWPEFLDVLAERGLGFKLRFGGNSSEDVPSIAQAARALRLCHERKVPIKLTQGLHHAFYQDSGAHGFLNLLLGACLLIDNGSEDELLEILQEKKAAAFCFKDKGISWAERCWSEELIVQARERGIRSLGSCSFEEPWDELGVVQSSEFRVKS